MSAIAGIFDLEVSEDAVSRLFQTMRHRGVYRSRKGNGAMQLLHSGKESDGGVCTMEWAGEVYFCCCDASIYNAKELEQALIAQGQWPQEPTAAQLLLRCYLQWGEQMLEKLEGSFALMIGMQHSGTVFMARDHLGVKPLFYKKHAGGLLVASEMKTILSFPNVEAELDSAGAAELLLLGPGRVPGSGVFAAMQEVRPGHCGLYRDGAVRLRRYWHLTDRPHTDSFEQTVETVRHLLNASLKSQLSGLDRVGAMLSGGLDSSLVCALCSRELEQQGRTLQTFSVDYEDSEKHFRANAFQPDRDTDFIRIMQQHLKCDHHWSVLSPQMLVDGICDGVIARDLPGMADVDVSLLLFCRQIRQHCDVVLSGECADEIFGGYPWYRDPQMRQSDTFPWAQTTRQRAAFLQEWITAQVDPDAFVHSRYTAALADADILPQCSGIDRRIKQLVNLNFDWFMQTLIDRGDRMGAACGLEVRMPFCDRHIAQYLYSVPWHMKDHGGREKGLLREAFRELLPQSVLWRRKSPYPKTYDPKYLQIVSRMLRSLLEDETAPIFQLVRPQALQQLLQTEMEWPWYGQLMRRAQTIVYMLQINYWLEHYSVRIK